MSRNAITRDGPLAANRPRVETVQPNLMAPGFDRDEVERAGFEADIPAAIAPKSLPG
ncbi:MAG: hypothetical protein ABR863_04560 [Roseiarcus sp.]